MKTLTLILIITLSGCATQEHRSAAFMTPEEYRMYSDEQDRRQQRSMQMMNMGVQLLTPRPSVNCYTHGNYTRCQ